MSASAALSDAGGGSVAAHTPGNDAVSTLSTLSTMLHGMGKQPLAQRFVEEINGHHGGFLDGKADGLSAITRLGSVIKYYVDPMHRHLTGSRLDLKVSSGDSEATDFDIGEYFVQLVSSAAAQHREQLMSSLVMLLAVSGAAPGIHAVRGCAVRPVC